MRDEYYDKPENKLGKLVNSPTKIALVALFVGIVASHFVSV